MRYFCTFLFLRYGLFFLHLQRNFTTRVQVIPYYVSGVPELYFLAYFLNIIVWKTYCLLFTVTGNALISAKDVILIYVHF
jgi:hypothetical protein